MGATISVADACPAGRTGAHRERPVVSIVIPTRNGGARLTHVIDAIRRQRSSGCTRARRRRFGLHRRQPCDARHARPTCSSRSRREPSTTARHATSGVGAFIAASSSSCWSRMRCPSGTTGSPRCSRRLQHDRRRRRVRAPGPVRRRLAAHARQLAGWVAGQTRGARSSRSRAGPTYERLVAAASGCTPARSTTSARRFGDRSGRRIPSPDADRRGPRLGPRRAARRPRARVRAGRSRRALSRSERAGTS